MSETYFYILAVIAGIFLSTNPFAIHLYSKFLVAHKAKNTTQNITAGYGLLFIFLVWLWLFIIAAIVYETLLSLNAKELRYAAITIAGFGIIAGFFELKKYNWPKIHSSKKIARIHASIHKRINMISTVKLSMETIVENIASYVVPVLLFTALDCFLNTPTISFLLFFTFALIASLVKVYVLSLAKVRMSSILEWNQNSKNIFRLCIGSGLVMLSWILLLVVSKVVELN